jgi:cell division protein FtsB
LVNLPAAVTPSALRGHLARHAQAIRRAFSGSILSLALGVVMLLLIGLLLSNFVGQVIQNARLEAQRAALAAEVADLRAQNAVLEGAVAFAESDVSVERIAREQLSYARDGDIVLLPQVSPPASNAPPAPELPAEPAPSTDQTAPNWENWWRALFPAD